MGADTGKSQQMEDSEPVVGVEAGHLRAELRNTLGLSEQEKENTAPVSGKAIPSGLLKVDAKAH